jgi:hypothetical protein
MKCSDCIARGAATSAFGFGGAGCKSFKKTRLAVHHLTFHVHDHAGQSSIEHSMSKHIQDHKDRLIKIFLTVL